MNPRHVAILGAGPVGLDAALAASDVGLSFTLYEAAPDVGAHLDRWGHVRLFTPWSMNLSSRMRARLEDEGLGSESQCPTGAEMVERVLRPLAAQPDVRDNLRLGARVRAVSREGLLKSDEIGTGVRATRRFRMLIEDAGGERIDHADVVLDCTGTYGNPNPLGDGGIPAPGEVAAADRIVREIPDVAGEPDRWAGKTTLVVGAGHSGQTAATSLAALARESAGTRLIWCLRGDEAYVEVDEADPLEERRRLGVGANDLLDGSPPEVDVRAGRVVDAITARRDGLTVTLRDRHGGTESVDVDRVVSLTGFVGDHSLYRQLQVHECYATAGPMKLAATLLGEASADCLVQTSHGIEVLKSPEPDFYLLGAKSYGRNNTFLLRVGYDQVDEVFAELGAAVGPSPSVREAGSPSAHETVA